ncbi:MAG: hypothetical protein MI975_22435 [Cytophagales bacterium]|nr:hypothetical protein [Cytophagales bacterium]
MNMHVRRSIGLVFMLTCLFGCEPAPKDFSLSIDEYMEMGMPGPEKIWDSEDLINANNTLSRIKWEDPRKLPGKGSKKSGKLFDRLISRENLAFLNVDSLALNEKALLLMNYLQVYENWRYIYTDVRYKTQYHHRELVDIQLFGLGLLQLMLDFADKIQTSDDPVDKAMRSGDNSIREMYIDYLLVTLEIQEDMTPYHREDMERMSEMINTSISNNLNWMDDKMKSKLDRALQVVVDSSSVRSVSEKYADLMGRF